MKKILLIVALMTGIDTIASNQPIARPLSKPSTVQAMGTPYAAPVVEKLVAPEQSHEPQDMLKVMERRNFLLKKAGFETKLGNLTPEERDYLDRALKVYPIVKI